MLGPAEWPFWFRLVFSAQRIKLTRLPKRVPEATFQKLYPLQRLSPRLGAVYETLCLYCLKKIRQH